jgi:hypothetical protein
VQRNAAFRRQGSGISTTPAAEGGVPVIVPSCACGFDFIEILVDKRSADI